MMIEASGEGEGVEALLERCAAPAAQTHYVSAEKLRADREKFKRLPDKPQHGYAKPLLSSQVFGWHCEQARAVSAGDGGTAALGVTKKFFPVTKTDVTLKEGVSDEQVKALTRNLHALFEIMFMPMMKALHHHRTITAPSLHHHCTFNAAAPNISTSRVQ